MEQFDLENYINKIKEKDNTYFIESNKEGMLKLKNSNKEHYKIGGSTIERIYNCPSSVGFVDNLYDKKEIKYEDNENEYTIEGTKAHALLEKCLKNSCWKALELCETREEKEMADYIQLCLDFLKDVIDSNRVNNEKVIILSEEKVILNERVGGTIDIIIYFTESQKLLIADYKHGMGDLVPIKNNYQLNFYTNLFIRDNKYNINYNNVKEIYHAIIQPRKLAAENMDGYRYTSTTIEKIKEFDNIIKTAIENIETKQNKYVSGHHCKYCPAFSRCQYIMNESLKTIFDENKNLYDINNIPNEKISEIKKMSKVIKKWLDELEKRAENLAIKNKTKIDGYKVVYKKKNRKWNEDVNKDVLISVADCKEEDLYELVAIGKYESLLKEKFKKEDKDITLKELTNKINNTMKDFTFNPVSDELELVDESDKREEVKL